MSNCKICGQPISWGKETCNDGVVRNVPRDYRRGNDLGPEHRHCQRCNSPERIEWTEIDGRRMPMVQAASPPKRHECPPAAGTPFEVKPAAKQYGCYQADGCISRNQQGTAACIKCELDGQYQEPVEVKPVAQPNQSTGLSQPVAVTAKPSQDWLQNENFVAIPREDRTADIVILALGRIEERLDRLFKTLTDQVEIMGKAIIAAIHQAADRLEVTGTFTTAADMVTTPAEDYLVPVVREIAKINTGWDQARLAAAARAEYERVASVIGDLGQDAVVQAIVKRLQFQGES